MRLAEIRTSDDGRLLLECLFSVFKMNSKRFRKGKGLNYFQPSGEDILLNGNHMGVRPCLKTLLFSKAKAC